MGVSADYKAFLEDIFVEFGRVSVRTMFGGAGVFAEGVMFALVADGVLYLKADDAFSPDFVAEGKGPFTYHAKSGRPVSMSYWEVPDRLLDDPAEFARWARRSHGLALAWAAEKLRRTRPRKRPPQKR
jgi:DNA transformation protein